MNMSKKLLSGALTGALVLAASPLALATPYTDSSAVSGASEEWNAWVSEWETVATDFTKVSLTPGADEIGRAHV